MRLCSAAFLAMLGLGSALLGPSRCRPLPGAPGVAEGSFLGGRGPLRRLSLSERPEVSGPEGPESLAAQTTGRFLNVLLVAGSVGYAAMSVFAVDASIWRGWTLQEVLYTLPRDNWLGYEGALRANPVGTKTVINVVIYLLGDYLAQVAWTKQTDKLPDRFVTFDAWRTARNGFIALIFGPLVHYYYQLSDTILPMTSIQNRLAKVVMDQTIYLSVKAAAYIGLTSVLAGESPKDAATAIREKLPTVLLTAWRFWPAVHIVTYGVIPARHRVLWVNCVDLVWSSILALLVINKQEDVATTAEQQQDAEEAEERFVEDQEEYASESLLIVDKKP